MHFQLSVFWATQIIDQAKLVIFNTTILSYTCILVKGRTSVQGSTIGSGVILWLLYTTVHLLPAPEKFKIIVLIEHLYNALQGIYSEPLSALAYDVRYLFERIF